MLGGQGFKMDIDMEAPAASRPNSGNATGSRARSAKVVSETTREREVFKYEPFLTTNTRVNESGRPLSSSDLTTSSDPVLTALAQLGLFQTRSERAFISLFDTNYQYLVAEATLSTPLTPNWPSDKCPTRLLLCGNAIPRNHGACEHVLYAAGDTDLTKPGESQELPLTLVFDLTCDDRFSSKPYCQIGEPPQFYAAVPIRTNRGINIGTYSVRSSKKTPDWDDECTRSLREISSAIMGHLEANRSTRANRRNERVNRGLGSFVEGKSTLSGWQNGPNVIAFKDDSKFEGGLDTIQQRLEHHDLAQNEDEPEPPVAIAPASSIGALGFTNIPIKEPLEVTETSYFDASRKLRAGFDTASANNIRPQQSDGQIDLGERDRSTIFSKAANIIRESFEVEGCMFFDVAVGSYRASAVQHHFTDSEVEEPLSRLSSTSGSDENLPILPVEDPDAVCELLGFSSSRGSSINAVKLGQNERQLPKQFLAKLLRRYPEGKVFNFDAVGELQSSDSSDDDRGLYATSDDPSPLSGYKIGSSASATTKGREKTDTQSRLKEGTLIHQIFASACSVAFIPIWDSKRERWFAGGFIYTFTPSRAFTIEGELSLLTVFSKLIASEVNNLETQQINQAKSDALGSLSHELRSPLHGVILGTELLNDTDLTVFQGNAAHTIETCCRTLLDTVDHLLDYAKVNSFAAQHKQESMMTSPRLRQRAGSAQFGKKTLYLNARLDGIVEEVIETVFAGYNFQYMSLRQQSRQDASVTRSDEIAHSQIDAAQAMEQLGPNVGSTISGEEQRLHFGDLSVYLQVDQTCDWMFYLPGGAIRRIILNLFGNSLKFTTNGAIWVSLSQEKTSAKRPRTEGERIITISVQDTGKGIAKDYIQHRLFKPFAQENELSPGTGLGLSLVKKIVSQLEGQILVESQVGVGTRVTVNLPLAQSAVTANKTKEDEDFENQVQELIGLRVQLRGFASNETGQRNRLAIVEDICRDSLGMEITSPDTALQLAPDIILWLEHALPEASSDMSNLIKTPNVVICRDALMAYRQFHMHESAGHGGVFDFISQPIGPRKLAKSIQLAYQRWMGLPKITSLPLRPPGLPRSHSSYGASVQNEASGLLPTSNSPKRAGSSDTAEIIDAQHLPASPTPAQTPVVPNTSSKSNEPLIADKILLVDDNHINLKILSAYMGKLNRAYLAVVNGKEARDAYIENPGSFMAILMDISMPVMDGLEATRQIRNYERQNHLPPVAILALTGLASQTTQKEALESGVDVYLTKPVRLVELTEALESMKIFP